MPPFKLNPPPANLPPGSSILAYLRDSGHAEQELSIQQQRNALENWASQHGLIISRFFIDEARRGSSSVGRNALAGLMHALRQHEPVQGVVVWSYARFSRGIDEPVLYRAEIRVLGYAFHSLIDDVPEGPMGRIFEAILDYKNHQHLTDMGIEIQRSLHENVRLYGVVPGTPPRGFMRELVTIGPHRDGSPRTGHRWVPDPETAPMVRHAFEMRAAGATLAAIQAATHLFADKNGYVTMWPNRLYTGTLVYGETVVDNYCAPVVDQETWDRVQEVQAKFAKKQHMQSDDQHPRRISSRYILSGLVRCALCDAPLYGHTSTYRNKRAVDTYLCPNSRKHTCTGSRIPREALETSVINAIRDYILDPNVALARQQLDAEEDTSQAQIEAQTAAIKKSLAKTRRRLTNISEAIQESGKSRTLLNDLANLEQEETSLLSQLAQLTPPPPAPLLTREQLAQRAEISLRILNNGEIEDKRAVLKGLLHAIKVQRNENQIAGTIFYYSPGFNAVRKSSHPPEALRYTHSIEFAFEIKKTRP